MFYDFESSETFSEIKTEGLGMSVYQDVWSQNLIKDTPFYFHNNNNNNKNYKTNQDIKGIYDTEDFPMTVFDIEEVLEEPSPMIKVENIKIEKNENSLNNNNNINILEAGEVIQTLMVPVIVAAKEEKYLSYKSDSEESQTSECSDHSLSSSVSLTEDDDSPAEDPKCWPTRVRRQPRRRYTTDESDLDWEPEEEEEPVRKKASQSGGRRKPSRYGVRRKEERETHRPPVPQRRKSGTKKITQWILSLLRDSEYNPRVLSWDNEEEGVFYVSDTAKFAKLWGERKKNPSMNYEKLSRAMRYYYKNGELMAVEKRTTYQFGSKSDYWRTSKKE